MRENGCKKWLHKNFTLATDDAIEDLKNGAKNTNTIKNTLLWLSMWKTWYKGESMHVPLKIKEQ